MNLEIFRPGLLAQVVPGLLSDLQFRGSSPCINNYPAKKKKKFWNIQLLEAEASETLFFHAFPGGMGKAAINRIFLILPFRKKEVEILFSFRKDQLKKGTYFMRRSEVDNKRYDNHQSEKE